MRKISLKKRGDFNFVWMFAIIAGTAILLLSIYGAVRFGKTASKTQDTEIAKTLSIITEPMQAGFASGKKASITFKKQTVIDNFCSVGEFGYNEISVMTQERPSQDFESFGVPTKITNKYLFSSDTPAKSFYVFSKPLEFAFKLSDLIIIDSREYCFVGLEDQEDYLEDLKILGSSAKFGQENCTEDSIKVCFGRAGDCDITVQGDCFNRECSSEFETGSVNHGDFSLEYVGNLLYPAIFSSKQVYECNVQRLLFRNSVLSRLYLEKTNFMFARGCNTNLVEDLENLEELSFGAEISELKEIYLLSKIIREKEEGGQCRLWS